MAEAPAPQERAGRVTTTLVVMRLLICSAAFLLAVAAGCLFGSFVFYLGLEGSGHSYLALMLGTALFALLLLIYLTVLPFIVFAALTEIFRLRSLLVHSGGGLMIALIGLTVMFSESGSQSSFEGQGTLIAAASGIVGGFVYWFVAGRSAGAYRERLYLSNEPGSPAA